MNVILLSGGSGKRLWPLSNEIRSKQFLKIYKLEDGTYESMVQRVYRQIKSVDEQARIAIATSKSQVSSILNQIGDQVGLSVEPCRKDTFPAIVLATAYMHDIMKVDLEEAVCVCPADHYVEPEYYQTVKKLSEQVSNNEADLVLMGIEPTYPSDKYGYIIPHGLGNVDWVDEFKEKPDEETAKTFLLRGALWNAGVFSFKLKYVLERAKTEYGITDYYQLLANYGKLKKISFDYAVVEKTKKIQVVKYSGKWRDIGSWSMFTKTMEDDVVGKVIKDKTCCNTHIINDLDIPILCLGLKDITIAASPDGMLVSAKSRTDSIKEYVENIDQGIMYAEKSWGVFHVVDVGTNSLTIKVSMKANDHMNYHSHDHRDEIWIVVSGKGKVIVDGTEQAVNPGDTITIKAGSKHTIFSYTDLILIEVQIGNNINVTDKHKYDLP